MAHGVLQQGNNAKRQSLDSLRSLVSQEQRKRMVKEQNERAEDAEKNAIVGQAAGMGVSAYINGAETTEGAVVGTEQASPVEISNAIEGAGAETATTEAASSTEIAGVLEGAGAETVTADAALTTGTEAVAAEAVTAAGAEAATTAAVEAGVTSAATTAASTTAATAGAVTTGATAAGGAAAGAEAGAGFGPWGLVIGAAAGALLSEVM